MANIGLPSPGFPNKGWKVWVTSTVLVIVTGLFVTARIIGRLMKGGVKLDDYTIIAAEISTIILTVTENMAVVNGYGKPAADLTTEQLHKALGWFYGAQIMYKVVISLSKASILLLYIRVFYVQKYFRWICFGFLACTVSSGIAFTLSTIWQCTPLKAFWQRELPEFWCVDNFSFWLSFSVISIVTDFAMLVLPIQQVLRLKLNRHDKIALIFVFALGAFVCVTSIIRATSLAASSDSSDVSYNSPHATVWSVIECNTGIICACLPMMRQPLSLLCPNMFSFYSSSRGRSNYRSKYGISSYYRRSRASRARSADVNLTAFKFPWTGNQDSTVMTSVSNERQPTSRTGSEENIIGLEPVENQGIVKTTNVSVSESRSL